MFEDDYERVIHPRRVGDIYLYTVRPGDNIYRIARNFNTTNDDLSWSTTLYSIYSPRTNAFTTNKRFLWIIFLID